MFFLLGNDLAEVCPVSRSQQRETAR